MHPARSAYRLLLLGLALVALDAAAADTLAPRLLALEHGWAKANYETPAADKDAAFARLTKEASALVAAFPDREEPRVWKAIVLSTHAGVAGGLSALGMARDARDLLLAAGRTDAGARDASLYTTLASLYHAVPGWPLGFGDDAKAEDYFRKALALAPHDIDANYFYAGFLHDKSRDEEAATYLEQALAAKPRPQRPLADAGRRAEATSLLHAVRAKLADGGSGSSPGVKL